MATSKTANATSPSDATPRRAGAAPAAKSAGAPRQARSAAEGATGRAPSTRASAGDASTGQRTRGGWESVGTSAARRDRQDTAGTSRGERTRLALIEAARRVFERDGYFEARVQDIVKEAGVAHGTFYTYFSSKRDMLTEITAEFGELVEAAVSRDTSSDPDDRYGVLKTSNERYLNVYKQNHAVMALIEHLATFDPDLHTVRLNRRRYHVSRVAATISRWQDEGLADPDIDPKTTAGALVSMLSNFSYWWFVGGDDYDWDSAAETLTTIWARAVGLAPTKQLGIVKNRLTVQDAARIKKAVEIKKAR